METRICRYCHEKKPLDTYEEANTIKGVVYRRWRCHKCYMACKKDRKKKIRKWFLDLKKTFSCGKCGENRYYVLDLHHRDPSKKDRNLGAVGGWSKERILKEISKCDVLCANCHREFHYLNNGM